MGVETVVMHHLHPYQHQHPSHRHHSVTKNVTKSAIVDPRVVKEEKADTTDYPTTDSSTSMVTTEGRVVKEDTTEGRVVKEEKADTTTLASLSAKPSVNNRFHTMFILCVVVCDI